VSEPSKAGTPGSLCQLSHANCSDAVLVIRDLVSLCLPVWELVSLGIHTSGHVRSGDLSKTAPPPPRTWCVVGVSTLHRAVGDSRSNDERNMVVANTFLENKTECLVFLLLTNLLHC